MGGLTHRHSVHPFCPECDKLLSWVPDSDTFRCVQCNTTCTRQYLITYYQYRRLLEEPEVDQALREFQQGKYLRSAHTVRMEPPPPPLIGLEYYGGPRNGEVFGWAPAYAISEAKGVYFLPWPIGAEYRRERVPELDNKWMLVYHGTEDA